MSNWQIVIGDKKYGASTVEEVRAWIAEGRIPPDGKLYHPSLGQWIRASQLDSAMSAGADSPVGSRDGVIRCPFCNSTERIEFQKFTTGGIIVLVAGLLLAPVCIGLIMIPIAFTMRERRFRCQSCKRDY